MATSYYEGQGKNYLRTGELDITGDLTITGPGADLLTISGNDSYRIFDVADGINVRLVSLTLTGTGGPARP